VEGIDFRWKLIQNVENATLTRTVSKNGKETRFRMNNCLEQVNDGVTDEAWQNKLEQVDQLVSRSFNSAHTRLYTITPCSNCDIHSCQGILHLSYNREVFHPIHRLLFVTTRIRSSVTQHPTEWLLSYTFKTATLTKVSMFLMSVLIQNKFIHWTYNQTIIVRMKCFTLHNDTTPPQPNHTVTLTHIESEQYNPWNNSTN